MPVIDHRLPHQIRLVFSTGTRSCLLNGETSHNSDVVVSCKCVEADTYFGKASTTDVAWLIYNEERFHNNEREKFQP